MSKFLQNYLRFWASRYLKKVRPQIIAITGSVGKTSTKEAIFAVMEAGFGERVRKSEGNLNTIYGSALAILGYKKPPVPLDRPSSPWPWLPVIFTAPLKYFSNRQTKYLVLEIAADKPGDIKFITSFVKPDAVVITNLGHAHLEIFGTLEKIIEEKTELLRALGPDGWAILNLDDVETKKIAVQSSLQLKTFAIDEKADIMARNITTEIKDFKPLTQFQIVSGNNKFLVSTETLGRQANVYPALAAAAVAEIYNLKKTAIISGVKNIRPEKHRTKVFKGKRGTIIIDDCYNANPLSMKAALNVLKSLPKPPNGARKIAVLGGMLELGKISGEAHQLIGNYAHEIADEIVAIGVLAKDYVGNENDHYFDNKQSAIEFLLSEIREGDILLIKASRGIGLEEVVEALRF